MFMSPTPTEPSPIVIDNHLVLRSEAEIRDLWLIARSFESRSSDRDGGTTRAGALALSRYIERRLDGPVSEQLMPIGPIDADDIGMLRRLGEWFLGQFGSRTPGQAGASESSAALATRLAAIAV